MGYFHLSLHSIQEYRRLLDALIIQTLFVNYGWHSATSRKTSELSGHDPCQGNSIRNLAKALVPCLLLSATSIHEAFILWNLISKFIPSKSENACKQSAGALLIFF